MMVSFEIADIDTGDVVGAYESLEGATRELAAFCEAHPERSEELVVVEVDAAGRRVGAPASTPAAPTHLV